MISDFVVYFRFIRAVASIFIYICRSLDWKSLRDPSGSLTSSLAQVALWNFYIYTKRNLSDLLTSKRLPVDPHHLAQRHNDIALPDPQSAHAQFVGADFNPTGIWRFTSNTHTRQSHLTAKINLGSVSAKPTGRAHHANIMGSSHIPSRAQTPAKASLYANTLPVKQLM